MQLQIFYKEKNYLKGFIATYHNNPFPLEKSHKVAGPSGGGKSTAKILTLIEVYVYEQFTKTVKI